MNSTSVRKQFRREVLPLVLQVAAWAFFGALAPFALESGDIVATVACFTLSLIACMGAFISYDKLSQYHLVLLTYAEAIGEEKRHD